MTPSGYWLTLVFLPPLLLALTLIIFPRLRRTAMELAPWAALPALLIALPPWQFGPARLPGLLLGTQIGLDETGRAFLLLSALVWWASGRYARNRFAQAERPGFFVFFLLAMAGNFGAIIAGGILSFYFSFALMSFAAYGLVIHDGGAQALRAGRVYIVLVVLGELLLLSALMLAANGAPSYDFDTIRAAAAVSAQRDWIVLLTVTGLGIKIGLPGLHFTLPLIYRAAPIPAAAAMAGAMINAGLLGWLRLLPLGQVALPQWGLALMVLGLFAAFYGVLVGLTQRDAKTLLAYSSISQLGLMSFAVGVGLGSPQAWPPILLLITLYAVHHGLAKAALFIGIDVVQGSTDVPHWRGLAALGVLLPALTLAGAPLTSGMLTKTLLKTQAGLAPPPWPELLAWLLPLSSLATTLLVARFLYLAWPRPGRPAASRIKGDMVFSWGLLLATSLALVWFLPGPEVDLVSMSVWWASLWPVATGAAIAFIVAKGALRKKITIPEIPPGDLLVPLESAIKSLREAATGLTLQQLPRWQERLMNVGAHFMPRGDWRAPLAFLEKRLTATQMAIVALVLLILVLFALTLITTSRI